MGIGIGLACESLLGWFLSERSCGCCLGDGFNNLQCTEDERALLSLGFKSEPPIDTDKKTKKHIHVLMFCQSHFSYNVMY